MSDPTPKTQLISNACVAACTPKEEGPSACSDGSTVLRLYKPNDERSGNDGAVDFSVEACEQLCSLYQGQYPQLKFSRVFKSPKNSPKENDGMCVDAKGVDQEALQKSIREGSEEKGTLGCIDEMYLSCIAPELDDEAMTHFVDDLAAARGKTDPKERREALQSVLQETASAIDARIKKFANEKAAVDPQDQASLNYYDVAMLTAENLREKCMNDASNRCHALSSAIDRKDENYELLADGKNACMDVVADVEPYTKVKPKADDDSERDAKVSVAESVAIRKNFGGFGAEFFWTTKSNFPENPDYAGAMCVYPDDTDFDSFYSAMGGEGSAKSCEEILTPICNFEHKQEGEEYCEQRASKVCGELTKTVEKWDPCGNSRSLPMPCGNGTSSALLQIESGFTPKMVRSLCRAQVENNMAPMIFVNRENPKTACIKLDQGRAALDQLEKWAASDECLEAMEKGGVDDIQAKQVCEVIEGAEETAGPSFWDEYKWEILGTAGLLLVFANEHSPIVMFGSWVWKKIFRKKDPPNTPPTGGSPRVEPKADRDTDEPPTPIIPRTNERILDDIEEPKWHPPMLPVKEPEPYILIDPFKSPVVDPLDQFARNIEEALRPRGDFSLEGFSDYVLQFDTPEIPQIFEVDGQYFMVDDRGAAQKIMATADELAAAGLKVYLAKAGFDLLKGAGRGIEFGVRGAAGGVLSLAVGAGDLYERMTREMKKTPDSL